MHSRAANEEALICLRAPERAVPFCVACYGHAGVNWAVIPFHLLILGTSTYLEKSRSSNEGRNLNLRN